MGCQHNVVEPCVDDGCGSVFGFSYLLNPETKAAVPIVDLAEVSRFAAVRAIFTVSGSHKQLILLVPDVEDRPKTAVVPTKAVLLTVDL